MENKVLNRKKKSAIIAICALAAFVGVQCASLLLFHPIRIAFTGERGCYLFTINAIGCVKLQEGSIDSNNIEIIGEALETRYFFLSTWDRFRIKKLLRDIVSDPSNLGITADGEDITIIWARINKNTYCSLSRPFLFNKRLNEPLVELAAQLVEMSPFPIPY